jgi:hypothetical protein
MERSLAGLIIAAFMLTTVAPSSARDSKYMLPVAATVEAQDGKQKLDGSVNFFSAIKRPPKILTKLATDVTNLKTNVRLESPTKRPATGCFCRQ